MSLFHHSLIAWQRADDVANRLGYLFEAVAAELETEIKRVGAPLAGLIRSERAQSRIVVGAIVLAMLSLTTLGVM